MAKLWSLCLAASTLLPVEAVRVTGADPLSAELLVVQLNAFEDDLAMNTQTRNMVVNEPAVNQALLPVHKTWPDVLAALSDAQGSGSGIGGFHRSSVNTWLKTNYKAVRFSFDPSMFLRLAECAFEPDSKVCKTRAAYLKTCARAEHLPCSYGADETGPTIALWDLDADLREDIPTPKTLWVRDDHAGSSKEWVEYHGVYGKLVKTLWGRLLDELPREVAVQVYAEITKVDTRLSWSFRAPYLLRSWLPTTGVSRAAVGI
ncbi:unnamed protein product [Effrenium voratum]|nr:unnamed protein product [Effrenium voratum]